MNVIIEVQYSGTTTFAIPDGLSEEEARQTAIRMANTLFNKDELEWETTLFFKPCEPEKAIGSDVNGKPIHEWFEI